MNGSAGEYVSDDLLWRAVKTREIERLEYLTKLARMLAENRDKAIETISAERPSMTERALLALEVYGRFGLNVRELYEIRRVWLFLPDEGQECTISEKGVSMLLRRLKLHDLADRHKEGREWRYWISEGGRRRLDYYRKTRLTARYEKSRLEELSVVLQGNRKTVDEMIAMNKRNLSTIESSADPGALLFSSAYSFLWKHVEEMAEAMQTSQRALVTNNPLLRELAFLECTKSLTSLKQSQELSFIVLSKGSLQ